MKSFGSLHEQLDPASIESLDVVIHSAGENIGAARWSESQKAAILKSRVDGTRFYPKPWRN